VYFVVDHRERFLNQQGFTLIEVMVGALVFGLAVVALAGGMNSAFAVARLNTENLRATQILAEKMDLIRACSWTQLTNSGSIPNSFTAPFYTGDGPAPPGVNSNFIYQGAVTIVNGPVTEVYGSSLKLVQVSVSWTSASVLRSRSATTLVSRYGIQSYSR
jgi:prepilin-type N-terminal cleavage/methylation domain-containing protein